MITDQRQSATVGRLCGSLKGFSDLLTRSSLFISPCQSSVEGMHADVINVPSFDERTSFINILS